MGCPPPHRGVLGSPLPMSEVLGSLLVRFGVWGLWDLGSHPPTSGGLGVPPPCQRSWGPYWSDLGSGGSGIWGVLPHIGGSWGPPPHVRGPGVPIGQMWGSLGFGVPPHIRGPGVPVGQIWGLGALGFGVSSPTSGDLGVSPPMSEVLGSLLVRFGGLWVLGSPHVRGSDLGGSGIWGPPISEGLGVPVGQIWGLGALGFGVPPHSRGSQPPSLPYQRSRGPYWPTFGVSGFWGPPCLSFGVPYLWLLGSLACGFWGSLFPNIWGPTHPSFGVSGFPPCPSCDAPGVWVSGFPLPQHLGSHTSKFWGLWVSESPMSKS